MARIYRARTSGRAYRDRARKRRRVFFGSLIKWVLYTLVACFLCVLEDTAFSVNSGSVLSAGAGALFLLPAWAASVGFAEGWVSGAWFGVVSGLLSSAAGGGTLYLLPPVLMAYGLLAGLVGERTLGRRGGLYACLVLAVCTLHAALRLGGLAVGVLLAGQQISAALTPLLFLGLREAVCSAVGALPLYLLRAAIGRLYDKTVGEDA